MLSHSEIDGHLDPLSSGLLKLCNHVPSTVVSAPIPAPTSAATAASMVPPPSFDGAEDATFATRNTSAPPGGRSVADHPAGRGGLVFEAISSCVSATARTSRVSSSTVPPRRRICSRVICQRLLTSLVPRTHGRSDRSI